MAETFVFFVYVYISFFVCVYNNFFVYVYNNISFVFTIIFRSCFILISNICY